MSEKVRDKVMAYFMRHFNTLAVEGNGYFKVHTKSLNHEQIRALGRLECTTAEIKRSGNGLAVIVT
tara:strand:+ start:381 stop:578 length:198 start_codon:yes stop_codon:yes gene_type:complete